MVITASDKTFTMIEAMLKTLDARVAVDLKDIRLIPLKNAEAGSLAKTLQTMMDARVQRQATTAGAKDADALAVTVMADPRSNSVLVGGSAEGFELVKSLAQQLDGARTAFGGDVQLIPLKHANAGTLSTTLTQLFDQPLYRRRRGHPGAKAADHGGRAHQQPHGRRQPG